MRAVLDTNVWLDWLVFEDPGVAPLRDAARAGELQPVASARLRAELAAVLERPNLRTQAAAARARRGFASAAPEPAATLAEFDAACALLEPGPDCGLRCTDPDDQPFLDLAVAAGARWLVSKDRALLALARRARARFGLSILAPAAFALAAGPARARGAPPDPRL